MDDVREWHADESIGEAGWSRINDRYGYDKYGGNCHVIPNHALVIHALVHGAGTFPPLGVVNSCGWDTDSNAGNVGCIAGCSAGSTASTKARTRGARYATACICLLPTAGDDYRRRTRGIDRCSATHYTLQGTVPPKMKAGARFHFRNFLGRCRALTPNRGARFRSTSVSEHATHGTRTLALRYHRGIGTA